MRVAVACCALTGTLGLLAVTAGAQADRESAAAATLPARYLVTTYNTRVNVTKPGAKVDAVELVDGHGRVLRLIDEGCCWFADARFSPNGRMIAWMDKRGLNVANANGMHHRLLVDASTHCTLECVGLSYAWAPDSATIAVGGAGAQTNELLTVNVKTGTKTRMGRVARFTEYVVIGYSPDGSRLAVDVESGDAGTSSCCKSLLVVERPDGTRQRVLFSFFDAIHDGPADATWSPDGTHMAFTDDGMDRRDPRFGIVDVAAATVRPVAGMNVVDASPVWSPDSSELTAVTYRPHPLTYSVSTVALASGRPTKIGPGDQPIAWYRDGTILTVGGENGNVLYALSAAGGPERRIFALPRPQQILTIEPAP